MKLLLWFSRIIDRLNAGVGEVVSWLILVVVLVSASNAVLRKTMSMGSNAALELQLYLFAAIFLLNGGYTLLRNEHVRIDVLFVRLSERKRMWIDIFGILFFLMPVTVITAWLTLPVLVRTYVGAEHSSSAGGLLLWPAWLLVPVGFALLFLQGLSELVKRIAQLRGIELPPPPGAAAAAAPDPLQALAEARQQGDRA